MKFSIDNQDGVTIFSLKEKTVTSLVAAQFKAEVLIVAQPTLESLLIDMTTVEIIDSSGLGALLLAHRQLKEHDIPVILVGVQEPVKSLMSLTRIDELFEFYPTVSEALLEFQK